MNINGVRMCPECRREGKINPCEKDSWNQQRAYCADHRRQKARVYMREQFYRLRPFYNGWQKANYRRKKQGFGKISYAEYVMNRMATN